MRGRTSSRIRTIAAAALLCAGIPWTLTARAVMAGLPPDTPAARIDPNRRESPWAGVGAVSVDGGTFSGVLVHPRFALTAAHVVHGRAPAIVRFQLNTGAPVKSLAVSRVIAHPAYTGGAGPDAPFDLALLELAEAAPAGIPIAPMYFGSLATGTEFCFVGYGSSGRGDEGPSVGARADVKRIGANTLDRFLPGAAAPGIPALFMYDFDAAMRPNVMGRKGLANERESAAASGDSGAPAFILRAGHWELFGVMTFVADYRKTGGAVSTFGSVGGGVLLGPSYDWITRTLAASPPH